jgi:ribosomal protein S27AE
VDLADTEMTLTEALEILVAEGFTDEFRVVVGNGPAIRCGKCGSVISPGDAAVLRLFRLEGESDPSEEVFVAGLRCPRCGALGTLVATYGPVADGADADVIAALVDKRRRD